MWWWYLKGPCQKLGSKASFMWHQESNMSGYNVILGRYLADLTGGTECLMVDSKALLSSRLLRFQLIRISAQSSWWCFLVSLINSFKNTLKQNSNYRAEHKHGFCSCLPLRKILKRLALLRCTTDIRNITHSKEFAGNQGNYQNFDPFLLPMKLWLIFMGMKQRKKNWKKKSNWPTQNI